MSAKLAYIYLLDGRKATVPKDYGMQLPTQRIAPFFETLNKVSRFAKLTYPGYSAYGFSFFNKPYMADILVLVTDIGYESRSEHFEANLARAKEVLGTEDNGFYHAAYLKRALWVDAGTQASELARLLDTFDRHRDDWKEPAERQPFDLYWLLSHPEGFVFSGLNEADFVRSLAMYSLGLAYHQNLSQQISRIAEAATYSQDTLLRVKQEAYRFNAQYYFTNPVKPAYQELYRTYEVLNGPWGLHKLLEECRQKLDLIAEFSRVRAELGRVSTDSEPVRLERDPSARRSEAEFMATGKPARRLNPWIYLLGAAALGAAAVVLGDLPLPFPGTDWLNGE